MTVDGNVRLTPQTREDFIARRKRDMARGAELAATEQTITNGSRNQRPAAVVGRGGRVIRNPEEVKSSA